MVKLFHVTQKEELYKCVEDNETETIGDNNGSFGKDRSKNGFVNKIGRMIEHIRPAYFSLLFCYLEIVLHYYAYGSFNSNSVWIILFSLGLGLIPSTLTLIFPRMVNRILTYVFTFLSILVFEVQLVYFAIFKGFAPVSSVKLGGQAITNFTGALFEGIRSSLAWIIILLLPLIVLLICDIFMRPKFDRPCKVKIFVTIGLAVVILGGTVGTMRIFFSGFPSLYSTFSDSDTSTDTSTGTFGLNITMLQEIRWMLFPQSDKGTNEILLNPNFDTGDQIDEIVDFEKLYEAAGDNKELQNLVIELSNMPVTKKNIYTGICEGYNLISICAEAFSPEFIDPNLTPTLYMLSNSGFIFDNFYSTFPNTTTNGEYAFCMGLFPDMSREKVDSSFGVSASNYLPYCYGNLFKNNGGIAKAYHNYVAEFYYRNFTHTNMGYDFVAANSGLDIEITWPSSDYDMMVASCDDYINSGKQFAAYYMTFSGHYQYTLDNAMSAKNWNEVKDMPYSDAVKAYIACNLELERALAYLMDRLEEAGIADKTVIVLTTDHYPYGLTDEQYSELAGREIKDNFDKLKNSFICYVPGLKPTHVDSYCSTVDILPTVLNLFGFTYDSRLLAGQDVLDPSMDHMAILADGSFITDGIRYDASAVQFKFDEETKEARERAEKLYKLVEKKFRVSTGILNNNFYSIVYSADTNSEGIDNLTLQYTDVAIMMQSAAYYVLKNDLMDPYSDTVFGMYKSLTFAELIDSFYRVDGKPEVSRDTVSPFTAPEKYNDAMLWAYEKGILKDDGLVPTDLSETVSVGPLSLITYRAAEYYGLDTAVDEAEVSTISGLYADLDERIIRASIWCRDKNIITGDGNEYYVFYASPYTVTRDVGVSTVFRLCSYYLNKD